MQNKMDMILKDPRTSKAHTGLTKEEFDVLLPVFATLYTEMRAKETKAIVRKPGWWRSSKLGTIEQKLFFILWYMKTNPKYDIAGVAWGVDKSTISDYIVLYLPLLQETLSRLWLLPPQTIEEFREHYGETKFDCIRVDATEREVNRSTKPKIQKKYYSGKKNFIP